MKENIDYKEMIGKVIKVGDKPYLLAHKITCPICGCLAKYNEESGNYQCKRKGCDFSISADEYLSQVISKLEK